LSIDVVGTAGCGDLPISLMAETEYPTRYRCFKISPSKSPLQNRCSMILAVLFGASAALEEVRVSHRPRARLPSPSGHARSNLVCHETNPGVQSLKCQRWLTQMMPLLLNGSGYEIPPRRRRLALLLRIFPSNCVYIPPIECIILPAD
jgi:hypothetical protein